MPVRYFPVSQEINSDAESWELTQLYGDRALRIWMEVLAITERTDNDWKLVDGWETVLGRKVRQSPTTVWRVIGWLLAKGWLVVRQGLASGWPVVRQSLATDPPAILGCRNYAKFHKTRAEVRPPPSFLPIPSEPKESKKTLPNSVSVSDFTEAWNKLLGEHLPKIRLPLTLSRDRKLRVRLKEHPTEDFWSEVFTAILKSDFLMGRNGNSDSGWRVSFDWLIENDKNCLKITEGNYANKH